MKGGFIMDFNVNSWPKSNQDSNFNIGDEIYYCIPDHNKIFGIMSEGHTIVEDIRDMPKSKKGMPKQILIKLTSCEKPTWIGSGWCWQTKETFDNVGSFL